MWKIISLAIVQSVLLTGGQVFLRFALLRLPPLGCNRTFFFSVLHNWQFAACGVFFLLASLLWMYMVRIFPFSVAYPLVSLSYVFGMLAAILFFHEQVPPVRWVGVLLIMAGCLLIPSGAKAQNHRTQVSSPRLQAQILDAASRMKSMQCDFVQTKQLPLLSDKLVSRGHMYYQRADHLRWEYTSPYTYTFILNDSKVLLKNSRQATVIDVEQHRMFREIARIMMNSVVGKSLSDEKDFQTSLADTGGEWVATLIPRRKELRQLFSKIILHFSPVTARVVRVELLEQKGGHTLIELNHIQTDVTLSSDIFAVH